MPYRSPPSLLRLHVDVLPVGEPDVDIEEDRTLVTYRFRARTRWEEHRQDSIEPVYLDRPWWLRAVRFLKMLWW